MATLNLCDRVKAQQRLRRNTADAMDTAGADPADKDIDQAEGCPGPGRHRCTRAFCRDRHSKAAVAAY